MDTIIAVAGATGNLGEKIINALLAKNAKVWALVRPGSDEAKLDKFRQQGVDVVKVDTTDKAALTTSLEGVSVVVSALQGLGDVILGTQSLLLEAAIAASVSRFIPSDYSTDYTTLPEGENRNFDLRRQFYHRISEAPIQATSIFNGAFADILTYSAPFVDLQNKRIGYWEDPDRKVDVTAMSDTAEYTAHVAMDTSTPRKLLIAGFQISAAELKAVAEEVFNTWFDLQNLGTLAELGEKNKKDRAAHPEGENELYSRWQQGQYLHSMFSTHHQHLDNDRYPEIKWTTAKEVLSAMQTNQSR